jgi:hypothetical protein
VSAYFSVFKDEILIFGISAIGDGIVIHEIVLFKIAEKA